MPPNILWIVLEDTSPRLGCYGDPLGDTPRIDAFATTARRYDRMFSTTGVCAPSRASLVTGMMPQSIGAQHMRTETHDVAGLVPSYRSVPPHYVTAVSEHLRQAGYFCTLNQKTDFQFGEPLTMWDRHDSGAGWWDSERGTDQPFFAMMTNSVTHESGMWEPSTAPEAREGGRIAQPETNSKAVRVPPYLADTQSTRRAIARQYDNIATADAWVGTLLDRLEEDGMADNTVVMIVGDHGEGLPRKKRWPYDSGTRVPLLIRWPDRTTGGASDRLVSGIDIAPTTLSIADIQPPAYMEGKPVFGTDAEDRSYVVTTRDRTDESYDMIRSIRGEAFRYVRHYYPELPYVLHVPYRDRHPAMKALLRRYAQDALDEQAARWFADRRPAEELYHLPSDPHEMHNLATDDAYSDVRNRLRTALDQWSVNRRMDESEAQMRRRMWPEGEQPQTRQPRFVVHGPDGTIERLSTGEEMAGPVTIGLYCPTQGASLTWAINDASWSLYPGPKRVTAGSSLTISARAVRYGFEPSEAIQREFMVS